jgi:hypothetical protein
MVSRRLSGRRLYFTRINLMTTRYALSVNTGIIDKPDRNATVDFARGWESIDCTLAELTQCVTSGYAIAGQYRNGYRKTLNFMKAGFVAADVDDGMALEEALGHPFVRRHASLLHTTASHTPLRHRYHVIFLLDQAILDAREFAAAQYGLALTLGTDPSVADGARMFFGNSAAIFHEVGKTMAPEVVSDLVARGRDARASISPPGHKRLPVDSTRKMGSATLVRLATGDSVRMDELRQRASVHCPYHDDEHPSAFAVRSERGGMGVHCSACKVTFWPNNERDAYDFGEFDRIFEQKSAAEQRAERETQGFASFFPPDPKFVRLQERFLPPISYAPGITLVKSPKGSGKTEALVSMIGAIRAGDFPSGLERRDRPKSILLIGHRRTLIREAAAKLGLRCYIGSDEEASGSLVTLAVCLDSLPKYGKSFGARPKQPAWYRKGPFDLVIIDEVEQVLKHLLSETIEKGAGLEQCFDAFQYEVTHAKAVFALDADLGLLTAQAMQLMRPRDWEVNCRIILNAPVVSAETKTMRFFEDRKALIMELIAAVGQGQRMLVTSNSKECILDIEKMIRIEFDDRIVMRVVTGDNSRDEATIEFVKNIKTEFLKVQVVLASPSMGTGVDITFPNGECKVDRVFGFFLPMVNAHTDIDQQLCRVRNPGAVDVWISQTRFNFTCNVEVVKDDLARAYTVRRAVRGRPRADGMLDYNRDDPLLNICAHVTALERASKNRLVELFCQLREANGWTIERVGVRSKDSPYNRARCVRREERAEMLLKAPGLNEADFLDLDIRHSNGAALLPEERAAHEKYVFERDVGVILDDELVEMNHDGRLFERIKTFAEITKHWTGDDSENIFAWIIEPSQRPKGRLPKMTPDWLIAVLALIAGLATASGFKADHVVSVGNLSKFVRACRENKTVIEEILSDVIRSDLEVKPVRQLNRVLARIGLRLHRRHSEKTDGRKVRFYALDDDQVERMTRLAKSYAAIQRQKEIDEELNGEARRPGTARDLAPEQGTKENSPYRDTTTSLLSLLEEDD